jgi:hypothetical protein
MVEMTGVAAGGGRVVGRVSALVGALVLAMLGTDSLRAHHSFAAQFDSNQPISLQGIVTKIEWMNPHVYFYIDVTDEETGEIQNWGIEMGPPHQLQRRDWKRNSMQIGDAVLVEATKARDGSPLANARRVTLESTGEVLGAASSEAQTIGRQ